MPKSESVINIILGGGWVVTDDKGITYFDRQGYEYNNIELGHKCLEETKELADEALTLLRHFCPKAHQVRYLQFEIKSCDPDHVEPF